MTAFRIFACLVLLLSNTAAAVAQDQTKPASPSNVDCAVHSCNRLVQIDGWMTDKLISGTCGGSWESGMTMTCEPPAHVSCTTAKHKNDDMQCSCSNHTVYTKEVNVHLTCP